MNPSVVSWNRPRVAIEDRWHRGPVRHESVRGQLESAARCEVEIVGEDSRINRRALANVPSEDKFRVALNRGEAPNIANLFRSVQSLAGLFFHADEAPNLIGLNIVDLDVADGLVEKGA